MNNKVVWTVTEIFRDMAGWRNKTTSSLYHVQSALGWLCYAQDRAGDGGVPAYYSLLSGWAPSYIETTGYIINTFLHASLFFHDANLRKRAVRMADFLLAMQLPSGGFRTHLPSQKTTDIPTVFDTAQDILGLIDIYTATHKRKYLAAAINAGDFLCSIQHKDGSWVEYELGTEPHVYNTRVAWSLLYLYLQTRQVEYRKSAVLNLEWARKNQNQKGWFLYNAFPGVNNGIPFTHTIAYAIEGFLYSGLILNDRKYISVAKKTADILLQIFEKHNYLAGSFDKSWNTQDRYTCLTGDAQLAVIWLELFKMTQVKKYKYGALRMNAFLKSTQYRDFENTDVSGGIKGSYPIYGDIFRLKGYCRMAYCNWATKFFIDALLLEMEMKKEIITI